LSRVEEIHAGRRQVPVFKASLCHQTRALRRRRVFHLNDSLARAERCWLGEVQCGELQFKVAPVQPEDKVAFSIIQLSGGFIGRNRAVAIQVNEAKDLFRHGYAWGEVDLEKDFLWTDGDQGGLKIFVKLMRPSAGGKARRARKQRQVMNNFDQFVHHLAP